MNQLSNGLCCHCNKLLRLSDRIYCLDNYQNLLQYVITNGLINLKLHKKCYIKLYKQQKTSRNDADKEHRWTWLSWLLILTYNLNNTLIIS